MKNIQIIRNKKAEKADLKQLKEVKEKLNKFYFVGITENPEDFLFIYYLFGITKFFPDTNISEKYFIPKDYEKTKRFILSKNKLDKELYEYVLKLNKEFKERNKNFKEIVENINIKREEYFKKIIYNLILLTTRISNRMYGYSAILKNHSETYKKFIFLIKRKRHKWSSNKEITDKKKPLYIFLHVYKCAGSTVNYHIKRNLKKNEFLLLYLDEYPYLQKKEKINEYLSNLTQEQKDKIKVIFGHGAYYGLDKLFPNREVRYITFLRNPIKKTISHYNFGRTVFKRRNVSLRAFADVERRHILNGKILSFKDWFLYNETTLHNNMFKFLSQKFFNKE